MTMDRQTASLEQIIGRSPAIAALRREILQCAPTRDAVLIRGERGTGKELVAAAIHANSSRRSRSLIPVNCAGLNDGNADVELFGSIRGSFTDAVDRPGILESAKGATVF